MPITRRCCCPKYQPAHTHMSIARIDRTTGTTKWWRDRATRAEDDTWATDTYVGVLESIAIVERDGIIYEVGSGTSSGATPGVNWIAAWNAADGTVAKQFDEMDQVQTDENDVIYVEVTDTQLRLLTGERSNRALGTGDELSWPVFGTINAAEWWNLETGEIIGRERIKGTGKSAGDLMFRGGGVLFSDTDVEIISFGNAENSNFPSEDCRWVEQYTLSGSNPTARYALYDEFTFGLAQPGPVGFNMRANGFQSPYPDDFNADFAWWDVSSSGHTEVSKNTSEKAMQARYDGSVYHASIIPGGFGSFTFWDADVSELWKITGAASTVGCAMYVSETGNFYYSKQNVLYRADLDNTGTNLWDTSTSGAGVPGVVNRMYEYSGVLYVVSQNTTLVGGNGIWALDITDGSLIWYRDFGDFGGGGSYGAGDMLIYDDDLFVCGPRVPVKLDVDSP